MAWVPGDKRLRANTAQGSPGIYGRLEPVPKSEVAIRWLNHQCRRMPTAIDDSPCRSGLSKVWLKIKNPKAPAATRAIAGPFCKFKTFGGPPYLVFRRP